MCHESHLYTAMHMTTTHLCKPRAHLICAASLFSSENRRCWFTDKVLYFYSITELKNLNSPQGKKKKRKKEKNTQGRMLFNSLSWGQEEPLPCDTASQTASAATTASAFQHSTTAGWRRSFLCQHGNLFLWADSYKVIRASKQACNLGMEQSSNCSLG